VNKLMKLVLIVLPCSCEDNIILCSFVLTQYQRVTHRRKCYAINA